MVTKSGLPWLLFFLGIHQVIGATGIGREPGYRQKSGAGNILKGPLLRQNVVNELSWNEADEVLKKIPTTDHIILFYIPLNSACRQFMNLFLALSQQFGQEQKHVTFAKVNCNGSDYGDNLCRRYNVTTVPTVVYVSSLPLQGEHPPSDGIFQRALRWCVSKVVDDIKVPNATSYKGDLFLYDELKDWATIMYRLSQLKRGFDNIKECSLIKNLRKLLPP